MSVTVSINGNISVTDSVVGTTSLRKVFTNLSLTGNFITEAQSASAGTIPVSVTLPMVPTQFVYLKNLHATQTLTVAWTPTGGSSNTVLTLQPGSAIQFVETAVGGGITTLTLTGSAPNTTFEGILAG
jgi:hypothetical protein